jgi:hypothetical protein
MPVDFSRLPPEQPLPDQPPSRFVWTVVFFALTIIGIFAVLLLWPKGEPARTPWFWICITVYPLGIAAFVVLRRYSVYESRRLDAIAWNDAREQHVRAVFDAASHPLDVLALSYRISSDAGENEIGGLLSGTLKLEPKAVPTPDTAPVKARWFMQPHADENGTKHTNDRDRQHDVIQRLFDEVLTDVADAVRRLPDDVKLSVQLMLAGSAIPANAVAKWQSAWIARELRPVSATRCEASDLMSLDAWLDRANERNALESRLLVFIQVHPVLQTSPPADSTEAAIAMLLAPTATTERLKLVRIAAIHRPMHGQVTSIESALSYALKWGRVMPTDVQRIWQSGLDVNAVGAATKAWVKVGVSAAAVNLDQVTGDAGDAAAWLSIACAAKAAAVERTAQLVAVRATGGVQFSVVRNASDSAADRA